VAELERLVVPVAEELDVRPRYEQINARWWLVTEVDD
jgi:hypothetical protein